MGTPTLPPLCMSALGAVVLLLGAGLIPWTETVLLLGVIAVFHSLPLGLKQMKSGGLMNARVARRSVVRVRR